MVFRPHIFFILFSCITAGTTCICQSLIAYYNFDNNTNDFSGNRNNGIIHGNIKSSPDRFGNPCGALQFDGISSYIEVPNSTSLETPVSSFTITVWYKFDNIKDNTWLTVLCKGSMNSELPDNPQYRFQVQQNTANVMNSCNPGVMSGSSTISINTGFTKCDASFQNHLFPNNQWAFYALVYNRTTVTAYMNNRKIFEYSYSDPLVKNTSSLYIGMDDPGNTEYFEGHLDDLYIYNRALSEQEINKLFTETRNSTPDKEEFEMPQIQNLVVNLPSNNCQVKVNFPAPVVTNSKCGTVSVRQSYGLPSGSYFSPGKHLVTYEAISTTGYEQHSSFYIIVQDKILPILSMPADTTILVKKGVSGTTYKYTTPTAADNCAVKSTELVQGLTSGSTFPLGKNIIKYKATDLSGNASEKFFSVEVKEMAENPVISGPVPKEDTIKTIPPIVPKTDTIVSVPPKDTIKTQPERPIKIDSTKAQPKDTLKVYMPKDLLIREKKELKLIEVNSFKLKGVLYDNGVFDGDTISLFLNKQVIFSKQEVSPKGKQLTIEIDTTVDNELLMYAENLGSIPPNTALLILFDGDTKHEINLLSTLKTNGIIKIRKRKLVPKN
jgi:hypothetical protein